MIPRTISEWLEALPNICQWTFKRLYLVRKTVESSVRYSTQIKPISYLKANAADVLDELEQHRKPLIITQNGEAKAVIQDVATYEETQETLALLKILALGGQQVERGEITPVGEAVKRLRAKAATP
jgi:prevent-host-death family protein